MEDPGSAAGSRPEARPVSGGRRGLRLQPSLRWAATAMTGRRTTRLSPAQIAESEQKLVVLRNHVVRWSAAQRRLTETS